MRKWPMFLASFWKTLYVSVIHGCFMVQFRSAGFILLGLLFALGRARSEESPAVLVASGPVQYRVKMTTQFRVPENRKGIDQVRVWHALPVLKPWSGVEGKIGAAKITHPADASVKYDAAHDSHHVYWEKNGLQTPGSLFSFQSEFTVRSVTRAFLPEKAKTTWQDYQNPRDKQILIDPAWLRNSHPTILEKARQTKNSMKPGLAVLEFARWVKTTIAYDASVSYGTEDMNSIMTQRRGHCGHQFSVLQKLCAAAGIPIRGVWGLNLYENSGRGTLHNIRPDWTNIHTWAEVYFPGAGWMEVDPDKGEKAFVLPAHLIQNNKWFQNYALWIRENGQQFIPAFHFNNGKYVSDYGVENVIQYSVIK